MCRSTGAVGAASAGPRRAGAEPIHVPRDASPGERYGVVWAETRASPPGRGGITQVSRVGIRVYLSVGPGGPPPSAFAIESLTAERTADGRPKVVARVHNTGGRALDMNGSLGLRDGPGDQRAGPYPATLGVTLAIGDTEAVVVALDKRLPAGPWRARLVLRSGLLHERRQATITFPGPEKRSWLPFAIGGAALPLLLVTLVIALTRRGRRAPPVADLAAVTGLRPGPRHDLTPGSPPTSGVCSTTASPPRRSRRPRRPRRLRSHRRRRCAATGGHGDLSRTSSQGGRRRPRRGSRGTRRSRAAR